MVQDFKIKEIEKDDYEFFNELAFNLRQQDKAEMDASAIIDYAEEVYKTIQHSKDCFKVVTSDGEIIAGFGIIPTSAGGQIWFLGTELLKQYRKSFVKISNDILGGWLKEYGRLYNFVSAKNKDSIKWLRYLGAKLEKKYIFNNHVFIMFEIEKGRMKHV